MTSSSPTSKPTGLSPSTTAWQRATELVTRQVEQLNETLGHTPDTDHQHRVTFGYLGNGRMTADGWDLSGVLWYVFLPHPGRVGTHADSLGGVTDGAVDAGRPGHCVPAWRRVRPVGMTLMVSEDGYQQLSLSSQLVLRLLAARKRLGHPAWTLAYPRHRATLRAVLSGLADQGWIGWKDVVEHSVLAWLTEEAERVLLSEDYRPPTSPTTDDPKPSESAWQQYDRTDSFGYERTDSQRDYEVLRDTIVAAFNPPDLDAAEPSLMTDTLDAVWNYVRAQPCTCPPEALVYDAEPCGRCSVLGERCGKREER